MSGAVLPLPNTSTWRDAQLRHRDNFTLPYLRYLRLTSNKYEGVSKSFRTGRLEREQQMVQLSATRCSFIAIL
jgi:hypothetical protein